MDVMDELLEIVSILSSNETNRIENFYKSRKGPEATKRLELFNALKQSLESKTEYSILKTVNDNYYSASAYAHLKRRLKEDIINTLMISSNPNKYPETFSDAKLFCRRLIAQSEILFRRLPYKSTIQRLELANKVAQDFELHLEQLRIDYLMNTHLTHPEAVIQFDSKVQNTNNYENEDLELLAIIFKAKKIRTHFRKNIIFLRNNHKFYKSDIGKLFKELKNTSLKKNSPSVKYWFYLISTYHYYLSKEYKNALISAKKLLKLIQNTPSINSPDRETEAKLQIAILLLYTHKYKAASDYAIEVLHSKQVVIISELLAMDILFLANFYKQDLNNVSRIYEKFNQESKYHLSDIIIQKWSYFNANLEFIKGNNCKSIAILSNLNLLFNDKAGWAMGIKMLELLNILEQKEEIWLEEKLLAFFQYVRSKNSPGNMRYKNICTILYSLIRHKFNYKEVLQINAQEFQLLSGQKNNKWDPFGSEIICFEKWFKSKTNSPEQQKNTTPLVINS